MISLTESLALYAQHARPLASLSLPVGDALRHVLAEPVESRVDLPMFTQSAVDGYALHSADSTSTLRVVGEIAAGSIAEIELTRGTAARIFTGGALPRGADTCARQEIVDRNGDDIRIQKPLAPGADTRFMGEEIKRGAKLVDAGQRLHSGMIASLSMAGIDEVVVRPRPRVAVIITGDEVSTAGSALGKAQIFDANGPLASAWLRERGYPLAHLAYVRDEPLLLREAIAEALSKADVVMTSGGVSVGDRDYVPEVAAALGVEKVFWKVAQKPGKPLWFGVNGSGKCLLGFPGNPAAVLIGLHIHAQRLLSLLEGETAPIPAWRNGVLSKEVRADSRDQLLRVAVTSREDGVTLLTPLPKQDSHMMSNLASAAGIAWIARSETTTLAGASARWLPI
jgi:molybdopterin molybdotransferase